jgi:hypothetical protein
MLSYASAHLWEPSLLAMNDDAVCLKYRSVPFASKSECPPDAPTGSVITCRSALARDER